MDFWIDPSLILWLNTTLKRCKGILHYTRNNGEFQHISYNIFALFVKFCKTKSLSFHQSSHICVFVYLSLSRFVFFQFNSFFFNPVPLIFSVCCELCRFITMNICNSQQTDKISIQHFKMSRLPMTLIDKSILFEMKYQECVSKSNFEVRFPHNRFDYFCFTFQMEKKNSFYRKPGTER